MNTETHTCVYCGRPATHQFKNGKWCCRDIRNKCPAVREHNSARLKQIHHFYKEESGKSVFAKGVVLGAKRITSRFDEMPHVCSYCGGHADYQLKNGRWCCRSNVNKCPAMVSRIAESRIGVPHSEKWKRSISDGLRNSQLHGKKEHRICRFCGLERATTKSGMSYHEIYCKMNPTAKTPHFLGKHVSPETKKRISEKMKIAHREGRAGTWIGLKKRSYAEQYWFNIFEKNLDPGTFVNNLYVKECGYRLDFAWPQEHIYFEVDGTTHYTETGIKHDSIRTDALAKIGWILIGRCNWSEYQKLSKERRIEYVKDILKKISNSSCNFGRVSESGQGDGLQPHYS